MSKRTFQGQNDAPQPAQGPNQHVHDNPRHGVTRNPQPTPSAPKHLSGSGPTGDASDMTAKPPVIYRHDGAFKKVSSTEKGRLDLTDRKQDE